MDSIKARYARSTTARTLGDIVEGADIFLGLSAGRVLMPDMVKRMGKDPLILALANPTPEISPEDAKAVRPDAIIATGRSDYPNQVNNVLCFPFLFRGALDVGATTINEEMKSAAVRAIAELAHAELSDVVADRLRGSTSGVRAQLSDTNTLRSAAHRANCSGRCQGGYGQRRRHPTACRFGSLSPAHGALHVSVWLQHGAGVRRGESGAEAGSFRGGRGRSGIARGANHCRRGPRETSALGRNDVIGERIESLGLRLAPGADCEIVSFESDARYEETWREYYGLVRRSGVTQTLAREAMRTHPTLIAAMLLRRGAVDAMLCGTSGAFSGHLNYVLKVIGPRQGVCTLGTMNMLILGGRQLFVCDTYVNPDPSPEQLAELTLLAAEELRRFGLIPSVALLSHSSFGSADTPSAQKMRNALALI